MATTDILEPRPCADGAVKVLHQISRPFSDGSIIDREVSVLEDGTTRKAVRRSRSYLDAERGNLELVAQRTEVPVPRVYDFYAKGEFEYLVMEKMPGVTLESAWPDLSDAEREDVADQVAGLVGELRRLQSPLIDAVLVNREPLRPGLRNTLDFTMERIKSHTWCEAVVGYVRRRCEPLRDAPNVFTHGDLDWSNVMVQGARVCGIIDLESGGFMPPHWEWMAARRMTAHGGGTGWFRLLEARLRRQQQEAAGMGEVEAVVEALKRHAAWALGPDERAANRRERWAEVGALLGVDVGSAPEVMYGSCAENPWWLEYKDRGRGLGEAEPGEDLC
ncbi:Protein kinase-like domain protein [Cordyceps fumosorosea ARSEF 2679]|uniref:Protein kinase-like domain protein n=1 Tax=Cordyceps fumosorosea (strain ARSEF 2679) TaxID=1081104 RepID=A0A167YFD7_CORFA|nr:Protein kinase-like domain protein [Cordyceps fumosorosea ARSEF 2679]OAA66261.1 Protein kinase-like domain protein [Cordyceps fumosorosea ARSEF 2679]